jgi:hypothetical protein
VQSGNLADALNRSCHCINVDPRSLRDSLESRFAEPGAYARLRETHPHLLADSPVFIGRDQIEAMQEVIEAVERVVRLPLYNDRILDQAPAIAATTTGPPGVFFGYDFHLTADGPRLIEINTNAGGALLLLHLSAAQQACCEAVNEFVVAPNVLENLETRFVEMFRGEMAFMQPGRELRRVAIVDESPKSQYLFPEFELFRNLFATHHIDAVIAGPEEFSVSGMALQVQGETVDLVYNRLTDFYLESDACKTLRRALETGAAVFTPGPRAHALYANKRNLTLLCDRQAMSELGADEKTRDVLAEAVPHTETVTRSKANDLWANRRRLYFKPARGFGSRGTYKGAKLTRKTWSAILDGDYIAQELVEPSERVLLGDDETLTLKLDVRCYVYRGATQLLGARMYRGQTTNFRTVMGGLATVFTTPPA